MSKELITKRMKIIQDLEHEANKLKEVYKDALEGDAQLQEVKEAVTKVKSESKEKEANILEKPTYKALREEIKKISDEIKDNREILSMELVDLYKESGLPEVEDLDGNIKKMKFSVKLVD